MQQLPFNMADVVVFAALLAIVALIVRGMLRGTIKTCDSASCSGDCGSCGGHCATPRLRLSKKQMAELDALTQQAKEA